MPCLYMHFYIEHNFGHHINVATPKDPATSNLIKAFIIFGLHPFFGNILMPENPNFNSQKK